jgi:pilus assembly protein CpaE
VPEEVGVLIIDSDERSRTSIKSHLAGLPIAAVVGEAPDIQAGLKLVKQLKPDLVIMQLYPVDEALAATEKIKTEHPHVTVYLSGSDPGADVILKAMRAGASEFLSRPVSGADLSTAMKKMSARIHQDSAAARQAGEIVTVFSNKGGVGTTTIATNLAVSLARETEEQVVIADLDLQLGDVTMFLNMKPRYTIVDVVSRGPGLDPGSVHSSLAKHDSGIYVLGEPARPEDADTISPDQVGQVLSHLRQMFKYVVVDATHSFEDRTIEVLDVSDIILLVVLLDLPNIRNVQRCLDIFNRLPGYSENKVRLVVNRYMPDLQIGIPQVERTLKSEVYWKIPNDYGSVINSINSGTPLVSVDGVSPVSASIRDLARDIAGLAAVEPERDRKRKKRFKLFGSRQPASVKGEK